MCPRVARHLRSRVFDLRPIDLAAKHTPNRVMTPVFPTPALRALMTLAIIALMMLGGIARAGAATCVTPAPPAESHQHHADADAASPQLASDPSCFAHGCCAAIQDGPHEAVPVPFHYGYAAADDALRPLDQSNGPYRPPRA